TSMVLPYLSISTTFVVRGHRRPAPPRSTENSMTEEWTQTLGAGPLLGIAAAAVVLILFLVIKVRLHAFLTLVLVSLLTALATGLPFGSIVDTLVGNFGSTLGSVALL